MWVVVESERQAEGSVMLLQQRVPVSALVQRRHRRLQLLEPRLLRLLDARLAGQVAPHHSLNGQMETQVAALQGDRQAEEREGRMEGQREEGRREREKEGLRRKKEIKMREIEVGT